LRWGVGIGLLVIAVLVALVGGYAWYLNTTVTRISVRHLLPTATSGTETGTENFLFVIAPPRCTTSNQTRCLAKSGDQPPHLMLLLHLDPAASSISTLWVPTGLLLPGADGRAASTVDDTLDAGGPNALVAAIEADLGIPIQHFVELGFDGISSLVDSLGGISMYFPEPVVDATSGLDVRTAGCLHLDGAQALEVMTASRLRYQVLGLGTDSPLTWPQEPRSDIARIRRDQALFSVMAFAFARQGLGNPSTDVSILSGVAPHLTVDDGLSASSLVHLVLSYRGASGSTRGLILPVLAQPTGPSGGDPGADYVDLPDEPLDQAVIDRFLGLEPGTASLDGDSLPPPGSVTVSVAGGASSVASGQEAANSLAGLGFHVVPGVGSGGAAAGSTETVVSYAPSSPAERDAAQLVVQSIPGPVIMAPGMARAGQILNVTVSPSSQLGASSPVAASGPGLAPSAERGRAALSWAARAAEIDGTTGGPSAASASADPWGPRACPSGHKA